MNLFSFITVRDPCFTTTENNISSRFITGTVENRWNIDSFKSG